MVGIELNSLEEHARQKGSQEHGPQEGGKELGILVHPRKNKGRWCLSQGESARVQTLRATGVLSSSVGS